MHRKGYTVIAYLDNFLLEPCLQSFNTLIELLQNLGFSLNWGKVINPFQWLIFLGIEIDTILRWLILPQRKMAEIHKILQFSVSKDKLTKRELQCIIGKLNFASRMIYGGRTFLRQIIDFCNKLRKLYHCIRLDSSIKADIDWWINFMEIFNGCSEIIDRSPLPQHVFQLRYA